MTQQNQLSDHPAAPVDLIAASGPLPMPAPEAPTAEQAVQALEWIYNHPMADSVTEYVALHRFIARHAAAELALSNQSGGPIEQESASPADAPRFKFPGESDADYRIAMGWDSPVPKQPAQSAASGCRYCKNITVCAICGKGYAEAVHANAQAAWLPIASAPKDGTVILILCGRDWVAPGYWAGEGGGKVIDPADDDYPWLVMDAGNLNALNAETPLGWLPILAAAGASA